ncbi:MAG: triphosphoribosyl-dephospho-CoA synthase [Desulfurococcales archaeon]|jgi:triphosphoribosyl-dephospho-CoA synthase|nr:triphosphoribosyl-dephospho-CoA synthase [Desulfurococcales archaeon]
MILRDEDLEGCSVTPLIAQGLYLEPVIHPKPGAVTPLRPHSDKSVVDFIVNASIAEVALYEACTWRSRGLGSPIARGFKVYRILASKLGLKTNIALGSLTLALPLAAALSSKAGAPVSEVVREAHSIVVNETGFEEAVEYYKLIEFLKPSHLGGYTGPVPSIGSGYPSSFTDILKAASWDLVHRELLEGYPITLEAFNMLVEGGAPIAESFLTTLLELLARHGDTLIASKYGFTAYKRVKAEALEALRMLSGGGVYEAVEWLDSLWRPRGWNPGAALDVMAVALGLLLYHKIEGK